jgi:predicted membrane-bound spermidine synthase
MTLILVACSAVIINKTYILGGIDGLEIRDHIRIFMNDGEMKKIEEDPTQTVIKK